MAPFPSLGLLYAPHNLSPSGHPLDGVAGRSLSNPTVGPDGKPGDRIPVTPATSFTCPAGGPPHDYVPVQWQVFWQDQPISTQEPPAIPTPPVGTMQGFVGEYALSNPALSPADVMATFLPFPQDPQVGLRMLPTIAQAFAVCDNWGDGLSLPAVDGPHGGDQDPDRWGLAPLTERDSGAPDLADLLTLDTPRTDAPPIPQKWPVKPQTVARTHPSNGLQRAIVEMAAGTNNVPPPPPPQTVAEVTAFLRGLPPQPPASSRA